MPNFRHYCEPCRFERKEVNATQFCRDCEEPEPLCRPCAKEHLKQKAGRDHKLSQNMEQFGSPEGIVLRRYTLTFIHFVKFWENMAINTLR